MLPRLRNDRATCLLRRLFRLGLRRFCFLSGRTEEGRSVSHLLLRPAQSSLNTGRRPCTCPLRINRPAQFIAATRGRKVDGLASCTDQNMGRRTASMLPLSSGIPPSSHPHRTSTFQRIRRSNSGCLSIFAPRSYWIPGSYVTSNSMSAGSNALPRLRTLCTNSKNPR